MGIPGVEARPGHVFLVSIAGGDSWVGIPAPTTNDPEWEGGFNRRWRFLGGDTWLFCVNGSLLVMVFQSQVAILGWGYTAWEGAESSTTLFQSQVAILGWGYMSQAGRAKRDQPFQSQVAILGWGY